ncbi:hypothetical protein B566_EDAN018740 [Ephemera danica]|nr:hypothetical protein B566_EDAN018740 [Ephemera danica]
MWRCRASATWKRRRKMRAPGRPEGAASGPGPDPIAWHPAMRRILWTLRARLDACRLLAYFTGLLLDESEQQPNAERRREAGEHVALLTPVAKAWFTELGHRSADEALQVFGGYGYTHEFAIEQTVRDSRIAMIYEGTNEALSQIDRHAPGAAVGLFQRQDGVAQVDGGPQRAGGSEQGAQVVHGFPGASLNTDMNQTTALSLRDPWALVPSLGNLDAYISAVNRVPLLTQQEETDCARRLQETGDVDAARKLVISHLRLVVSVSRQYQGYGLPQGDLIQEGNVGLMKAVKRFDPEQGVRLVSYALHWIKAEIHEYILRNWRMVKMATTKAQRKLFFNLRSMKQRLKGNAPDADTHRASFTPAEVEQVARELNVKPEEAGGQQGNDQGPHGHGQVAVDHLDPGLGEGDCATGQAGLLVRDLACSAQRAGLAITAGPIGAAQAGIGQPREGAKDNQIKG